MFADLEVGFETAYVRPKKGRTLIVGSYVTEGKDDRRKRYKDVVGVDMRHGPGVDRVLDMEVANENDLGMFDHVECTSMLEHVKHPWLVAVNIERMLNPGGTLFVTVPFNWRVHAYPDDYFRMTLSGIQILFENIEWLALKYSTYNGVIEKSKIPFEIFDGHRFYARSVSCGFGRKK